MTVIELVERERARLRIVESAATLALVLVVTIAVIGAGAWLLGESRWISLPRVTPLLVWSALALANGAVLWWALRRLRVRRWRRPSSASRRCEPGRCAASSKSPIPTPSRAAPIAPCPRSSPVEVLRWRLKCDA